MTDFFATLPVSLSRSALYCVKGKQRWPLDGDGKGRQLTTSTGSFIPNFWSPSAVPPTHPSSCRQNFPQSLSSPLRLANKIVTLVFPPSPSEKVNSFRRGGREGEADRRGMKAGSGRSAVHSKKRNKTARKLHGSWLTLGEDRPAVYKGAKRREREIDGGGMNGPRVWRPIEAPPLRFSPRSVYVCANRK